MDYKNRIIGEGVEDPAKLVANPKNWRVHPQHQQDALDGVLSEVGWVQRVIVNQKTGHIVDGHLRVSLALEKQEKSIPVVYDDYKLIGTYREQYARIGNSVPPLMAKAVGESVARALSNG